MKIRDYTVCLLLAGVFAVSASAAMSDFSIGSPGIIYNASESLNPSPVIADNGSWICCFTTTGDAAPGGRLLFVQSLTGQTWTRNISADKTSKHGDLGSIGGYISKAPNGDLVLAVTDVNATTYPQFWNYRSEVEIYINSENSAVFPQTPLAVLPTHPLNMNAPSAPVRFLSNGDWILPGYYRDNATSAGSEFPCGFWRSSDNGATWGAHELAFPIDWRAFGEIDIVERADHSLLAVVRTDAISSGFEYANGQLFSAESFDFGHTWTAPQLMGIPGHSPALIRWGDGAVMLGCRRLSESGNWTSVYIAEDGVNFQFAFDAIDPMGSRTSGTGYPIFTKINGQNIYMAYYAGTSTLTWTTYCAGNIIHDDMGLLECGDYGYLTADLSKDCRVNLLDFAALADNWLASTMP